MMVGRTSTLISRGGCVEVLCPFLRVSTGFLPKRVVFRRSTSRHRALWRDYGPLRALVAFPCTNARPLFPHPHPR